ncbi:MULTISPECIES: pilus assembly protein N-terminal domain-containing protein [Myxococcus]|uniref:pilus assembly protein N-terminal domain-containing protein n=1 Tax=Myxococcus TaxID=32 RepID=UPI0013D765C1|nr:MULTISPECIES: pilus assembly protein N-terminal domain-containing protein [Myxococcus]NVJ25837.1 pilus assembly protein N-terminal domain-containing protein [Myxococcus sp. AM011]
MRNGLVGLSLMALALVGTSAAAEERIELKAGEQRVLDMEGLSRLALGDPETAEVKTLGKGKIEVTGKVAGTTTMLVWKRNGERLAYTVVVTEGAAKKK